MSASLDLYRIFFLVAQNSSLSGAARILEISQPAVSQAIRQLETRLSCSLFVRTVRGVELTPEGRLLYGYAEQALGLVSAAEEKLASLKTLSSGDLTIGASDTLCQYYLLPYLEKFNETCPEVQLHVTNRTTEETVRLLEAGKVDLAFVNLPLEPNPQLEIRHCLEIHDTFLAGKRFTELQNHPLSWQELASLPLILLEKASNSRRYLDHCAAQAGVRLTPAIELGAHSLLVDFARIGLGVACVTREFVGHALDDGMLTELVLEQPLPPRNIGLATRKGVPLSFAALHFTQLIESATT